MAMHERPDGSQATVFGWLLIAVGALAAFVSSGAETLEGQIWGIVVANLGIGLGIILVSLGYLVRAIWFLPGREIEKLDTQKKAAGETGAFCDWCHLWVEVPGKPCSHSEAEAIRADTAAALAAGGLAPACRKELVSKGYIEV